MNVGAFVLLKNSNGEILFGHRREGVLGVYPPGVLDLPGGTVDITDPSPTETVIREVFEETKFNGCPGLMLGQALQPLGMFVKYTGEIGSYYFSYEMSPEEERYINHFLTYPKEIQLESHDEHLGFGWFAPEAIGVMDRYQILPLHRDMVDALVFAESNRTSESLHSEVRGIDGDFYGINTTAIEALWPGSSATSMHESGIFLFTYLNQKAGERAADRRLLR